MKKKQAPQPAFKVGDKVKRISQTPFKGEERETYHTRPKIGETKVIQSLSSAYGSGKGIVFDHYTQNSEDFLLVNDALSKKRAILRKSTDGTFYYSLFHGNTKCIGTNRGINRKQDALDTLANSFGEFEVIDETKKK